MSKFDVPNAPELAWLAALVAVEAPARRSSHASGARINWGLIHRIREELTVAGFDWKLAATERKRIEDERKRADIERRYPPRKEAES